MPEVGCDRPTGATPQGEVVSGNNIRTGEMLPNFGWCFPCHIFILFIYVHILYVYIHIYIVYIHIYIYIFIIIFMNIYIYEYIYIYMCD